VLGERWFVQALFTGAGGARVLSTPNDVVVFDSSLEPARSVSGAFPPLQPPTVRRKRPVAVDGRALDRLEADTGGQIPFDGSQKQIEVVD
jgi:hypothetical protein